MPIPEVVSRYLHHHRLVSKETHHPAAYTAQQLAEVEHLPESMVVKTVFFFADGQLIMGVLPANRHLNLHCVKRQMKSQAVRLATEHEIAEHIVTLQLGAIPPFGSLFGLPVFMDQSLLDCEMIEMPAGVITESLKLRLKDFIRAEAPHIIMLTKGPIRKAVRSKSHTMDFFS